MVVVLGAVAWASPQPWWATDRDVYERMGREWIVPGCNDFHCFRPLVSWVLGRIPGPPLLIWKIYAVLCQAAAGWLQPRGTTLGGSVERRSVSPPLRIGAASARRTP